MHTPDADRSAGDRATALAALQREGLAASTAELASLAASYRRRQDALAEVRAWLAGHADLADGPG